MFLIDLYASLASLRVVLLPMHSVAAFLHGVHLSQCLSLALFTVVCKYQAYQLFGPALRDGACCLCLGEQTLDTAQLQPVYDAAV